MYWYLLLSLAIFLLYACVELSRPIDRRWSSSNKFILPPGPQGALFFGNILEFWKSRREGTIGDTFLSLRSYGEMTTLRMGSSLWVLLNTNRVTDEIIGKRARVTHERPPMPIAGDLVSKGMRSVTQPTKVWTRLRRSMRPLLNANWTRTFTDWQDRESLRMLVSYLDDSSKWYLWNSRYTTGVMYGVITGNPLDKSEEEMQEYRQITTEFLATIQSTMVDFFPWLAYLPRVLQPWRAKWEMMGQKHHFVFKSWWDTIKLKVTSENASESWVKGVVLNPSTCFEGTENEAMYLTNTVMSAGGDNPRIALNTCLMAGIVHPQQLQVCRKELDEICDEGNGQMRLPDLNDIPAASRTCAFIKECLRWRPVVPMIPPHTASQDFDFENYTFPKGTSFIINVPAVCADYRDSATFLPERWIDGLGNEANLTSGFWGFGGGRRICIGYKAAQPALFLPFARLVFCYAFERRAGFDDRKVNAWSSGEPFPLRVQTRSLAHEALISYYRRKHHA